MASHKKSDASQLDSRREMKKPTSLKPSKTNWRSLRELKKHQIKLLKEHPEINLKHVARAIVRKRLKPITPKTSIALRVNLTSWSGSNRNGPAIKLA